MRKRKVVLFIASSLDGFIATKNESMDWLEKVEGEGDNGYSQFYDTVDTLILGKNTYNWIVRQGLDQFPYPNKKCYVLSNSQHHDTENVTFISDNLSKLINKLKEQSGENIWLVGGGDMFRSFLKEGLVDEIILTVAPTILGTGIPLFKESDNQVELLLKGVRTFNQFVELHYIVKQY